MDETYLGLDIGTSSVKAVLLDRSQSVLAQASVPLEVQRPHALWSEQSPDAWWAATDAAVAELRARDADAWSRLRAVGLSGQMHGATLLDADGAALRPAMLWNDGRSGAQCATITARVPDLTDRAGNIAMPGFTAPKVLWVAEHEPAVFAATRTVLLPKDYVRFRMTGAMATDPSDASGTLWLDVGRRDWDDTLLAATGLTRANMPTLVEGSAISANVSGAVATAWGIASDVAVAGGGGDNAASAVGIGAIHAGQGFLSLGTSGVLFAVTERYVSFPARTMHGFCHALPGRWHAMSVHLSAASALAWVAALVGAGEDIVGLLATVEGWAATPRNRAEAPVFLPYLSGERTPHNDPEASGMFAGLRMDHGAPALAYAVLEGVAFAFADGLSVLGEAGARLESCLLVGGGARSPFWCQMLADVLDIELLLPAGAEAGAAFGAARLAMLAAGGEEATVCVRPPIERVFTPRAGVGIPTRLARYRALYQAERSARLS